MAYKIDGLVLSNRKNTFNKLSGVVFVPSPTPTPTSTPAPTATPTPTPTAAPPSPPSGLSACCISGPSNSRQVTLSWNPVYGQGLYGVWSGVSAGSTSMYKSVSTVTNSITLAGYQQGTTWYFAVSVGTGTYGSLVSVSF